MKITIMFLKAPVYDNFKFGGQSNHDISILSHVNLISFGVENKPVGGVQHRHFLNIFYPRIVEIG